MSDNKVIRTTVLTTRSYLQNDTKFVVQQYDGTKKAAWNTLMRTLTSTLPLYTFPPTTPPPTTPPGTGTTTPPPSTPPPTTPPPFTAPPTTTLSYGHIGMSPAAGSGSVGSPMGPTVFGDTGSFGSGLVEVFVANESTGGGYSQIFSGTKSGSFSFPINYTPSVPGNYSFQARITVSGHTTSSFSVVGGWEVT